MRSTTETVRGTRDYEWFEDKDQFTAVRVRGRYVYAVYDRDWKLWPTELTVGQFDPEKAGLSKDPAAR
jgi:hypothetical protein